MWSGVMLVTVVVVMVLLCSRQCDCLSRKGSNKNNHRRSKDRSVDLPSPPSSSSSPHHSLAFDEFDESIFERFGLTHPEHERTGSAIIHNYFISILPTCPTAYKLTLLQNTSSRGGGGGSDNKGKKTAQLRTGQYTLCKYHGAARLRALRECSGPTKSCGLTKNDYLITDVESFDEASPPLLSSSSSSHESSPELNGVGDKKEDSTEMGEHCLPRKCSTKQLMAINMKNNMDCGSFYICIMGQHFLLHCPVGNQFSEEYGVCIEKKFANCKLSSLCKF